MAAEPPGRQPLSRDRVIEAAVDLADRAGLGALTMRRLGSLLGVEAMALYKHVANKDEILDGIVELVIGEIEVPSPEDGWKTAMRRRARSARRVLRAHPWAIGLMESRSRAGAVTLDYLEAVIGALRAGGFSLEKAAHAFWLLDSYVYGHVIQEVSLPFDPSEQTAVSTGEVDNTEYPNLAALAAQAESSGFDIDTEFEFGLELILDSLDSSR